MSGWRHLVLVALFLGGCLVMAGRVAYLSVSEREFLQDQGDARSVRRETIPAHRGIIFDRHGEPLAVSTPVVSVWVDPAQADMDRKDRVRLAAGLGLTPAALEETLDRSEGRRFAYLARRLSADRARAVAAMELPGVYFQSEYRRYYPASETAAHVVGMTNVDDAGLEGIELSFDDRLRGAPGSKVVLKDRRGRVIENLEFEAAPRMGSDLTLSLDLRLQFFAYRELKSVVASLDAAAASLVMLDATTGEVLALVNQPSYNPNERQSSGYQGKRNLAATDTYEPGSTIKPFTVLAALESGRFSPATLIDTAPGYLRIGTKLVQDPVNRGVISLAQALAKSSQVAFAKVSGQLDERAVFDVLGRAGIGEYLGTGLPGETTGSLSEAVLRTELERATLAYGYGLAVSPLQLAQAYLCIANGGVRMPVSMLRLDAPPTGVRVFEPEHAAAVLHMMEAVVSPEGTAPKAAVPSYRVAGKTGTSRKVGANGYDDERHVALFAGIAPATDPRIVMVVVVDEPQARSVGGGSVAAPVFARVAARTLRLLGVHPDGASA